LLRDPPTTAVGFNIPSASIAHAAISTGPEDPNLGVKDAGDITIQWRILNA